MKNKRRNYEEFEHSWENLDGYERTTKFYFAIRNQRDEFFRGSYTEIMDWEGDEPSNSELDNVEEILNEMLHEGCFTETADCTADLI